MLLVTTDRSPYISTPAVLHWSIPPPRPLPLRRSRSPRAPRRPRTTAVVGASLLLLGSAAGCADGSSSASPSPGPTTGPGSTMTAVPPPATAPPLATGTAPATTSAPLARATTIPTTVPRALTAPCPGGAGARDATGIPPAQTTLDPSVQSALATLRAAGGKVGVAVSIDGRGDVLAVDREAPLVPASNQKLLVAVAALEAMGTDATFPTTVVATGPIVDGSVQGDLVLVGGGDPTLVRSGAANSLEALVTQVRDRGITSVSGRVLVDESRFDALRGAPGWSAAVWQSNIGPLSALVVDRNRGGGDPTFFEDPARTHGATFRDLLAGAGIPVTAGAIEHRDQGPLAGEQVAAVSSPPLGALMPALLGRSDNVMAEILVKELGVRRAGSGTTADGLRVARDVVAGLCVRLDGRDQDGSGLGDGDLRTTGGLLRLLEVATTRPWWPDFRDGLAVAGRSGTMAARLGGPETAGRVQAKTGSFGVARSLSGYITTARGNRVVFSIILNGGTTASEPAVEALVTALATTA